MRWVRLAAAAAAAPGSEGGFLGATGAGASSALSSGTVEAGTQSVMFSFHTRHVPVTFFALNAFFTSSNVTGPFCELSTPTKYPAHRHTPSHTQPPKEERRSATMLPIASAAVAQVVRTVDRRHG